MLAGEMMAVRMNDIQTTIKLREKVFEFQSKKQHRNRRIGFAV